MGRQEHRLGRLTEKRAAFPSPGGVMSPKEKEPEGRLLSSPERGTRSDRSHTDRPGGGCLQIGVSPRGWRMETNTRLRHKARWGESGE